jgi:succinate-acetate transporter protein
MDPEFANKDNSLVVLLLAIALLRASIALLSVFLIIAVVLILLGVGNFVITRHHTIGDNLHKAAGAFGLIGGLLAMYIAMAGLLTPDTSYFTIPVGDLSPK